MMMTIGMTTIDFFLAGTNTSVRVKDDTITPRRGRVLLRRHAICDEEPLPLHERRELFRARAVEMDDIRVTRKARHRETIIPNSEFRIDAVCMLGDHRGKARQVR